MAINTRFQQRYLEAARSGGKIDRFEAEALTRGLDRDDRAFLRERLKRDAFDPAAKQLVKLAVEPRPAGVSGVVGMPVGEGKIDGRVVTVTAVADLGAKDGYGSQRQAELAARMSGKPAAAVFDGGRWRAVEINLPAEDFVTARAVPIAGAPGPVSFVPPLDEARYRELYAAAAAKTGTTGDWRALVAYAAGVSVDEVVFSAGPGMREPGKINFEPSLKDEGKNGLRGNVMVRQRDDTHAGIVPGAGDVEPLLAVSKLAFTADFRSGVSLLLHEHTHVMHLETAAELVKEWGGKTASFDAWVDGNRKLHPAVKALAKELVSTGRSDEPSMHTTEALAGLTTYLSARAAHSPDAAGQLHHLLQNPRAKELLPYVEQRLRENLGGIPAELTPLFRRE